MWIIGGGGYDAKAKEYPHMVSIYESSRILSKAKYFFIGCSGLRCMEQFKMGMWRFFN